MKKLFGSMPIPKCVDTIAGALKKIDIDSLEKLHRKILKLAANNKVLRQHFHRGLRFFAFDGFEPLRSRKRSCKACHTATYNTGSGEVTDYFHRFVFLLSIGDNPELILGIQPQQSHAQLKSRDSEAVKAEGELTAVKHLVDRLRNMFPKMFDAGIGDALYSNGPMINFMKDGKPSYDIIAVLKKENDEPMAYAAKVFDAMPPSQIYHDNDRKEHIRLWDSEGFQTLESSKYPLRVIKAQIHKGPKSLNAESAQWDSKNVSTWWLTTTLPSDKLSGPQILNAQRRRWDEENAFCELTMRWNIKHPFIHHEIATVAMMYAFAISFNLFQLFIHRCLRNFSKLHISALEIVEQFKLDYPQINDSRDGLYPRDFG